MATKTIQIKTVKPEKWKRCGHCESGNHQSCSIGVFQKGPPEKHPYGAIILCLCEEGGCELGRIKCRDCKITDPDQVDPATWKCFDSATCEARRETKRSANPLYAELREAKERAEMAKTQKATEKAATKAPKVGKCLVTGKPTKGGLFLPGMDARYCSERVADVMEKRATKAQALTKMKEDGTSPTLQAKFEKNLGIAQDKAKKKADAAKDKAAAKAEAAKEKANA